MPYGSRFVQQLNRTVAQRRAEWHNLSRISGKTIAELDRDLTAPDPKEEDDEVTSDPMWGYREAVRRRREDEEASERDAYYQQLVDDLRADEAEDRANRREDFETTATASRGLA